MDKTNITVTYPRSEPPETRVIPRNEQAVLEDYLCRDLDLPKLGVLICLYTGLRIGEICALLWGDISLSKSVISVSRTMQRVRNTGGQALTKTQILTDTPKSKKSARDIPVPKFIVKYMREYRNNAVDGAYLLTGRADKFIEPRTYQLLFAKYIRGSGITPVNFHATRHTMATRCVEAGFDIKSLSEILGHANVATTLNRYVHSSFEQKRRNMMKLERVSKG